MKFTIVHSGTVISAEGRSGRAVGYRVKEVTGGAGG